MNKQTTYTHEEVVAMIESIDFANFERFPNEKGIWYSKGASWKTPLMPITTEELMAHKTPEKIDLAWFEKDFGERGVGADVPSKLKPRDPAKYSKKTKL